MRKKIALLIEVLNQHPLVFAYLFGSKVKGYANERSDWDLAVYFAEPVKKSNHWPAFELEAELSRSLGATAQVTVLNAPLSPVLGFEIVKHGIVLLDRDENLRMDFENRTLRTYFDWQYFLRRQMEKG